MILEKTIKFLFVFIALCLLIGCQKNDELSDAIVIVQAAEPRTLDPQVATGNSDFRVAAQIFEGLVRFKDNSLEIEPALAKKWTISETGKKYTFYLRENIAFHDGSHFNAEVVKFNFERMLNSDHPYYHTGPFPLNFFFSVIESIKILDKYTIEFNLEQAFAPFLANLAYPTGYISSQSAIEANDRNYGRNPCGTGPYRFSDWQSQRRIKLIKWDKYWDQKAHLEAVYFKPITDENTRLTEILSGGCDVILETPSDIIQYFRQREDFTVVEATGPHLWFLILNTAEGPLKDVRVRQAVNLAIDKEGITKNLLQNTATIPNGPIPEAFTWAYDNTLPPWDYNPEKAKELIRSAGAYGKEILFLTTESGSGMLAPKAMATAIQADLNSVGLKVKIETYEWNTYLTKVNKGLKDQADMAQMAWMTNDPDTLPYLTLRSDAIPEKGGFNSGYYSNDKVDTLIEEARAATDLQRRSELYKKVSRIVHEEAAWAFIASWKQNAVTANSIKNFELQPSFLFNLNKVIKVTEETEN